MSSDPYRALNPQCKIPTLLLPDGSALYESRVISAFLADKYRDSGPSLLAETPEARARALLLNSIHDLYIASPNSSDPAVTANQGCGYKGVELIDAPARAAKLREVAKQVGVLEGLVVGPYAAGAALTEADCALYPTLALLLPFCLEHAFGWPTQVAGRDGKAARGAAREGGGGAGAAGLAPRRPLRADPRAGGGRRVSRMGSRGGDGESVRASRRDRPLRGLCRP
mmetsp:Transcript_27771/g.90559  ORF Transcript_27771/g.90559 Transcript_27771/m.90559 type:complete len:226 (+) Transcript_27771:2-679(+)